MGRSGFLALVHRELKRAARESERRQKALQRSHVVAAREAVSAKKRELQQYAQAQKVSIADQKRFEKEANESHHASMAAEVERLNLELSEFAEDLDGILAATLDMDDFVDLETLRVKSLHPPFLQNDLLCESRPPLPIAEPPVPTLVEPAAPRGIMSVFGKKGHEKRVAKARARYEAETEEWKIALEEVRVRRDQEASYYEQK